jgi:hypothetical protein
LVTAHEQAAVVELMVLCFDAHEAGALGNS